MPIGLDPGRRPWHNTGLHLFLIGGGLQEGQKLLSLVLLLDAGEHHLLARDHRQRVLEVLQDRLVSPD